MSSTSSTPPPQPFLFPYLSPDYQIKTLQDQLQKKEAVIGYLEQKLRKLDAQLEEFRARKPTIIQVTVEKKKEETEFCEGCAKIYVQFDSTTLEKFSQDQESDATHRRTAEREIRWRKEKKEMLNWANLNLKEREESSKDSE